MLCVCQGNSFTGMFVELAGWGFLWVTQGVMILTSLLKSALIACRLLTYLVCLRSHGEGPINGSL